MGIAGGLAFLAVALFLSSPGAAAPPGSGDWNLTGTESYADQTITLLNVTDLGGNPIEYGNVSVAGTGDLSFNNVTLVLPFQATLDIQGRATFRNSTIRGPTWKLWLRGTVQFTDDSLVNATFGAAAVETSAVVLERIVWNCGGAGGTVAVRRAVDFRNQTLENGCVLSYELPILAINKDMEIADVTVKDTGGATGITFSNTLHTGRVRVDLHRVTVNGTGGGWGLYVDAASLSTSYSIHDNSFSNTGSAAIRCDSFDGGMAIWNTTFTNVLRAFRMDGLPNGQVVATADNVTVIGTTDSIWANEVTWVIRNSTLLGASPQFDAGTNGHIKIYDSADSAFAANYPGTGGSIEHFIPLQMAAPTWQGGVAILDDLVTVLDANGAESFQVNASTWTPREIVWWGMYPGNVKVDNRALRPTVLDGGVAFNCTPASFLVSPGMALTDVTCTDDFLPTIAVLTPTFPRIQNTSLIAGTGRVDEAGSGLNTIEFSLDGSAYGPVTFAPGDARNFSFSRAGVPDGLYRIYLRAVDRTANARTVNGGPLTLDTVPPTLTIDPLPVIFSGSSYSIAGTTEPNTTVTVSRAGGFTNTTRSVGNGSFALGVLLEEGQNAYVVMARDAAGNTYSLVATTIVDTKPPALLVLLDGRSTNAAFERNPTVLVEGSSEATAQVRVSGLPAVRTGQAFAIEVPLARGLTNLTVVATDAAGNTAWWFGAAYFDDLPPVLAATLNQLTFAAGSTMATRSGAAALAGTAWDDETGVASLLVNGKSLALDGAGGYSTALALTEGENVFVITASDAVGNTASLRLVIARDTTPPGVSASIEADASPIVLVRDEAHTKGATAKLVVVVTEDGTATFAGASHDLQAGENAFVVPLSEGRNGFTVSVADLAGNVAPLTTLFVERRSLPPVLTVSAPFEGASVDTDFVEVRGLADPLSTVRINGQPVTVTATGEFRAPIALAVGGNSLRVEATDPVGNVNSTTRTLTRTVGTGPVPTTAAGVGGLEGMVFLIVGLAAGAAGGSLVARGRSGQAGEDEAGRSGSAPAPAPEPRQAEPKPKGPKGPRGPGPQGP